MKKIITPLLAVVLLCSCHAPQLFYAPAKITSHQGKLSIQPLQKFTPMPDTTVYGFIIRGGKP